MSTMTITYAQDVSKIETSNHVAVVEQNQPIDTPTTSKPIVSLVDAEGYKISRGYGDSIIEAINDMHHNFI